MLTTVDAMVQGDNTMSNLREFYSMLGWGNVMSPNMPGQQVVTELWSSQCKNLF